MKIRAQLLKFRDNRNWSKFHTPERIGNSLLIEAGELAKEFQWGKVPDPERVLDEMGDVQIYLEYLMDVYGVTREELITRKMAKNAIKYPLGVDHAGEHGWNLPEIEK